MGNVDIGWGGAMGGRNGELVGLGGVKYGWAKNEPMNRRLAMGKVSMRD